MKLEIRNLSVEIGELTLLKDINLTVSEGEVVGVVGPNGAGKSTLLKAIMGLINVSSGEIMYNDKKINGLPTYERVELGLALVPEGRHIFPNLTVRENLLLGAYVIRKDKKKVEERIEFVLDLFPWMRERLNQLGGNLSGGQQQMLAIARALMSNPKLLLLDEPSAGLAPIIVSDVYKVISTLKNEVGISMLLVDQNVKKTLEVSDRAYVLERGRLVLEGRPEELYKEDIVRAYMGVKV